MIIISHTAVNDDLFHYHYLRIFNINKDNYDFHIYGLLPDKVYQKWLN